MNDKLDPTHVEMADMSKLDRIIHHPDLALVITMLALEDGPEASVAVNHTWAEKNPHRMNILMDHAIHVLFDVARRYGLDVEIGYKSPTNQQPPRTDN